MLGGTYASSSVLVVDRNCPGREIGPTFTWTVEYKGLTNAVAEVTGIRSGHDIVETRTNAPNGQQLTLSLYQMRKLAEKGQVNQVRSTCIISLRDRNMTEIARFEPANAWPAAYEIVPTGDIPVEQVTFTHEGLKRTK